MTEGMSHPPESSEFAIRRARMVEEQIAQRGVRDPAVLAAMRAVPRHLFVPASASGIAYEDQAIAIGDGQTISQPYMVAVMTEMLQLSTQSRVLDVGTGSGYQAAILGSIAREVLSIERNPTLAEAARRRLAALGFANVRVLVGDGTAGLPADAPFDAILIAAAAPSVPEPLLAQLAESGRLLVPVGPREVQDLVLVTRIGDSFVERRGEACVFVPLVGRYGWGAGQGEF